MREIYRILDANLNRLREGLRVLEEIARFVLDDEKLTSQLKDIRHQVTAVSNSLPISVIDLLEARESSQDVGADSWTAEEMSRDSLLEVVAANCKRVQEASRVLEEFGKMCNIAADARAFKRIRFTAYSLEKELWQKICTINENN